MIRRHAAGFRALLIAADALLAVVLLVGLSAWRFGDDWAQWWRLIVPVPEALLIVYATSLDCTVYLDEPSQQGVTLDPAIVGDLFLKRLPSTLTRLICVL